MRTIISRECGAVESLLPNEEMLNFCKQCGARIGSFETIPVTQLKTEKLYNSPQWTMPYTNVPRRRSSSVGMWAALAFPFVALLAFSILVIGLGFYFFLKHKSADPPIVRPYPSPYASPASSPTLSPSGKSEKEDGPVLSFGGEGIGPGLFKEPSEIAVDNQGRVYVADQDKTLVFAPDGRLVKELNLKSPWIKSITLDKENNIYIISKDEIEKYAAVQ